MDWAALFAEGCAAAERAGDLPALVMLNTNYSVVCSQNQGSAPDSERYAAAAVTIADRTADAAVRCGTRAWRLLERAHGGQLREAERVCDEVIELAKEDPHLGAHVLGFSPLLTARFIRHRCIGFTRDPATALREVPRHVQVALDVDVRSGVQMGPRQRR